jgi:hypothetical protein
MRIETDLLGVINENAVPSSVLQRKFLLRVTAEQLSQWLQFDRKGKAKTSPFRISAHSIILIDEEIQRGRDAQGYLLQNPKKILEIASTLLKPSAEEIPRLYLGSLIWNVRPALGKDVNEIFATQKIEEQNKPTKWRLAFDTNAIYLTDSAHRHLGIVEAYRQYLASPEKFPAFNPKTEFSVELYTLSTQREKELFTELNSKQKKISAAKKQQMDVSSPIGAMKDSILDYDRTAERFFLNNIEVSSNQNDKHTLMTMNVFQESISEMFSSKEIKAAREDEELRNEMAAYYCDFFYELAKTIVVRADLGDGEKEYHPFRNLYTEVIQPAQDAFDPAMPQISEEKAQEAIERAMFLNRKLRIIDVANHNSFVRAIARLGCFLRGMENWRDVITRLQTRHNIPSNGKFFQKENAELFAMNTRLGVSIATPNENGSINVQVQTKTRDAIYEYLLDKLNLKREFAAFHSTAMEDPVLMQGDVPTPHIIPKDSESYSGFTFFFFLPRSVNDVDDHSVRLDIDGGTAWPAATRKNKAKGIACTACELDSSYVDDEFEDIVRWRASFEVPWPAGASIKINPAPITLKFHCPKFEEPTATEPVGRSMTVNTL